MSKLRGKHYTKDEIGTLIIKQRQEAKKEVFDDIDKSRLVPDDSDREKQYEEIKKRHLSPSNEGAGNYHKS